MLTEARVYSESSQPTPPAIEGFLRGDVKVRDQRHLMFATDQQLEYLARTKTWYIDATFKAVQTSVSSVADHKCIRQEGRPCKTSASLYVNVRTEKERLPKSAKTAS